MLTEYFKHAAHYPFFSFQNAFLKIILPFLVHVLFTLYIKGVLKFKNKFGSLRVNSRNVIVHPWAAGLEKVFIVLCANRPIGNTLSGTADSVWSSIFPSPRKDFKLN
jgi:hypothetical protein